MMRIVLVGAGDVGSHLSLHLSNLGHAVTVIESASEIARAVDEQQNVKVLHGNGSSASTLVSASVDSCDFFMAMTADDLTNLVSCSLAKKLGAKTTIARIHDATFSDTSIINYQLHFGIDILINPEALCAVELAKRIRHPGRVSVENLARGQIEVQQVRVGKKSKLAGKSLKDLKLGGSMRIGYVQRGEELEVAGAETVLQKDDLVTLFGNPETLLDLKGKLDPEADVDSVRVVIQGGDETAIALIRLLTNARFKIRLIDKIEDRCTYLAERFPDITVINGDAGSLRLLEEEQVGKADYFVACTRSDEINIMTALQARQLGTAHVQAVIHKADYEELIGRMGRSLGFDTTVSPRQATVHEVLRYISEDRYLEIAKLPNGTGQIVQLRVAPESSADGKLVREVQWPRSCVVVALIRRFSAKVPEADDRVLGNDEVVVIVRDEALGELRALLGQD